MLGVLSAFLYGRRGQIWKKVMEYLTYFDLDNLSFLYLWSLFVVISAFRLAFSIPTLLLLSSPIDVFWSFVEFSITSFFFLSFYIFVIKMCGYLLADMYCRTWFCLPWIMNLFICMLGSFWFLAGFLILWLFVARNLTSLLAL